MRSSIYIIALCVISVYLSACGGAKSGWAVYTSGEGGFTVEMPADPKKTQKDEITAFGKQTVHFISWKPSTFSIDKFKLFQVSYTNVPASLASDSIMMDVMMDSCIRMRVKDFTEKDVNTEPIELNGYPGRAFIYDVPGNNTIAIVKQCIVNNKRYDLTVVAGRDQGTNPEINRFFNSFQVLK